MSARGPARALARVEARQLLRHPAFLAGLAVAALGTAVFARETLVSASSSWEDDAWTSGVGFLVLAILTMIATNLAALRDRRSGMLEQAASLPIEPEIRTTGSLASTLVPAATAVVLYGAVLAYAQTRESLALVEFVHLLELGALVVLMGAVGIALAAWIPSAIVAPIVAWGLFLISPPEHAPAWQILWPLAFAERASLSAWHLVEIVGLVLVVAAVALRRSSTRRSIVVLGIAGVALVGLAAAVMIPDACIAPGVCSF